MNRATKIKNGTPQMTEAQFTQAVIDLAHAHKWRVAHFRPALTKKGWRTPVQADGAGFPDLVLARRGVVVFAELKTESGALTRNQMDWAEAMPTFFWRPSDWPKIERVLK